METNRVAIHIVDDSSAEVVTIAEDAAGGWYCRRVQGGCESTAKVATLEEVRGMFNGDCLGRHALAKLEADLEAREEEPRLSL